MSKHLSYVAITDEMAEAACKSYHEDFAQYANREAMKHALEAALACAPSQDVADEMPDHIPSVEEMRELLSGEPTIAPSVRRPSRAEIISVVEPFLDTYASPEQIADAVLALFGAER